MLTLKTKSHFIIDNKGIKYYSMEGLDIIHEEMLRLLRIIGEICTDNNIPYWVDGGSLIGAIRHSGFIPWDDDLDISVLKTDYTKLIDLLQAYSLTHEDCMLFYEPVQRWHACNYFASTLVFSRSYGSEILIPIKVDIRPLNGYKPEKLEANKQKRDIANTILFHKNMGYYPQEKINKMSTKEKENFFIDYNYFYGHSIDQNFMLAHPYYEFSNEFPLQLSDIFPLVDCKFEDMIVKVPCKYDRLLTELYGNYMALPAIENRAPVAIEVVKKQINIFTARKNAEYISKEQNCLLGKIRRRLFFAKFIGYTKLFSIKLYER